MDDSPPVLDPGMIHVWGVGIEVGAGVLAALARVLAPDEQARAARFYFERDRRRFVMARAQLRAILGMYLGRTPAGVAFVYNEYGKPALAPPLDAGGIRFNLAHSGSLALVAVGRDVELGVDLEEVREMTDALSIAGHFFSARESTLLRRLPPVAQQTAFFNAWTRKEAYLKAAGTGLAAPLDTVEVTLAPDDPARFLSIAGDPGAAAAWTLHALAPAPGYTGALAVPGQHWQIACWSWPGGRK